MAYTQNGRCYFLLLIKTTFIYLV